MSAPLPSLEIPHEMGAAHAAGCPRPSEPGLLAPGRRTGEEGRPPPEPKGRPPVKLAEEALRIHREAIVVDGHNDLPWQFRKKKDLSFRKIDLTRPQKGLHTDIPRLRQGGVGAQFWSAYVDAG